jgi:osmotically-inducible protein OsmY
MAASRRATVATVAVALSLSLAAGGLVPSRVEAAAPSMRGQRDADRAVERRLRGAIRADPFLSLAAPRVKVKIRRGVIRLVGRVGTAKERSSIAFKAGQVGRLGDIDDRVTVGEGVEAVAW